MNAEERLVQVESELRERAKARVFEHSSPLVRKSHREAFGKEVRPLFIERRAIRWQLRCAHRQKQLGRAWDMMKTMKQAEPAAPVSDPWHDTEVLDKVRGVLKSRGLSAAKPDEAIEIVLAEKDARIKELMTEMAAAQTALEAERAKKQTDSAPVYIEGDSEAYKQVKNDLVLRTNDLKEMQEQRDRLRSGVEREALLIAIGKVLAGELQVNPDANRIVGVAQETVKAWLKTYQDNETFVTNGAQVRSNEPMDHETRREYARAHGWSRTVARVSLELDAYGVPSADSKGNSYGIDDRLRWLARKADIDVSDLPVTVNEFNVYFNQHDTVDPKIIKHPSLDNLRKSARITSTNKGA